MSTGRSYTALSVQLIETGSSDLNTASCAPSDTEGSHIGFPAESY